MKMEQKEAIERLREILNVGDTVYTILRHVSRSGMLRAISVITVKNNDIIDLTYLVSKALGWKRNKRHEGINVNGCGMDMGFHLVYTLSSVLYPKGFKTPEGYWRNEPLDFDPDGGYALKQRWL